MTILMHRIFIFKCKQKYSLHSNADKCNFLVLCLKNYTICCTKKNTQKPSTQNFSPVHTKRVNVAFNFLQLQKIDKTNKTKQKTK